MRLIVKKPTQSLILARFILFLFPVDQKRTKKNMERPSVPSMSVLSIIC